MAAFGLDIIGGIKKRNGQSLTKDPQTARVRGLSYRIGSDPLSINDKRFYIHRIRIDGWEYTIQNDSHEYPILSFKIMDRFDQSIPEEYYVSDIKTLSSSVVLTERAVCRALQLFRFFTRQIDRGHVPDIEKALRIYKLHPLQLNIVERNIDMRRNHIFTLPDLKVNVAKDK